MAAFEKPVGRPTEASKTVHPWALVKFFTEFGDNFGGGFGDVQSMPNDLRARPNGTSLTTGIPPAENGHCSASALGRGVLYWIVQSVGGHTDYD